MPDGKFKIDWIDHGHEPQCRPHPGFPNGKDIDASQGAALTCSTELPYPAKRCGLFIVDCEVCGFRAAITTAGRPDDPRSVKLPCRPMATA